MSAGNHTLIGLYDMPLLIHELYLRGYKVRGLAHPGHWATPLGPLFQSLGAVKASPMAAYRLLQNAEAVLLFPGGGREVNPPPFMSSAQTLFRSQHKRCRLNGPGLWSHTSTQTNWYGWSAVPKLVIRVLCLHASQVSSCSRSSNVQVNKRKGEKYQLIWKDKPDFVRMAAKSKALIIPFAAVGGDDAFDIAMDTDEVLGNPLLGPLARRLSNQLFRGTPLEGSDDAVSPITKLPGLDVPSLLPLPKLERLYFRCTAAMMTQHSVVVVSNAVPYRLGLRSHILAIHKFVACFSGNLSKRESSAHVLD